MRRPLDSGAPPFGKLFDLTSLVTPDDLENQQDYARDQRQDAYGGESRRVRAYTNSRQHEAEND